MSLLILFVLENKLVKHPFGRARASFIFYIFGKIKNFL